MAVVVILLVLLALAALVVAAKYVLELQRNDEDRTPTHSFKVHIGDLSPFFVPRTSSKVPAVQLTGPCGTFLLAPVESGDRWSVTAPGRWAVEGVYRMSFSSGELYEILVQPPRNYLRPSDRQRKALATERVRGRTVPINQADPRAAFGPKE